MADSQALLDNYAGAFDGRLLPGKRPALLLIDMVDAYLLPDSPLYCEAGPAAVASAARLARQARASGIPVILTNVEYEPGGANGGVFYRKVPSLKLFDRGSPLGAFPSELQPVDGDLVVTKQYPSAFFDTGLAEQLKALEIDTILLGGFSTSGCVRASALDAMQYGFIPLVVRSACADRHAAPHESNLFDLQAKYAEIIDEQVGLGLLGAQ